MRATLWTLHTLASHWWRNPVQLAAMVVGLALATALWSGVQAINAEARASYARAAELLGGQSVPVLLPGAGSTAPQSRFVELRRAGHLVSPVIEGRLIVEGRRFRLIGIEPVSMPEAALPGQIAASADEDADLLAFFLPPWQAFASPGTIAELAGAPDLPPLIPDPGMAPGVVITDIGVAQRLLARPGDISYLLVHPGEEIPAETLSALDLRPGTQDNATLEGLTDSFHLNLTAFGFLAYIVGLFIVHAAIGLATEQRLAMFRTLRACGISARRLAISLMVEVLSIALISGLAGVIMGYVVAGALLPDVASSLSGLYGVAVAGSLTLSTGWWLSSLGMSLVGAIAAVSLALITAYRMPPLASARPEAWRAAQQTRLAWCGGLAGALGALGLAGYVFGTDLAIGFATMGAVLLGAALLLPVVLDALLRVAASLTRSTFGTWVWADMRQQLPGLSLALMALLLALSANIGVGTMVEGFRTTFLSWLDQRLAAELYVRGADEAQHAEIEAWIAARPEVDAVLSTRQARITVDGHPVEVLGVTDHATYRTVWPRIVAEDGAWDAVFAQTGAMISEQASFRLDLTLGDPLPVGARTFRVVGIYPDYGNPLAQAVVAGTWLMPAFPETQRLGSGIRLDPAGTQALIADLRAAFDLAPDQVIDQTALKAQATAIFEKTFAVTAALNVLTLAVAGVALFTSMLTLADRRLPQVAPLWAIGITRRDLAVAEMGKTLGLAILTALVAVPLGILLAHLLVAVINVQAFGWRLPLHLFPLQWLQLGVLSVAIAGAAAFIPVMKLRRIQPARLLKVFADAH